MDYAAVLTTFCKTYLTSAIKKIREGGKLEFNEEYAIESLWHEIRHVGAKGWPNLQGRTAEKTNAMETINQFCARRSYGQLVKALGGKVRNQEAIIANGYGYGNSVANLNSILEFYGVKPQNLYRYFRDRIQTSAYEDIYEDLAQYLTRNIGLSIDTIKKDLLRPAIVDSMSPISFRIYLGF